MPLAPEIVYKDADEVRVVTFDFTNDLNTSATISTIVSIVASPALGAPTFANNSIVGSGVNTKVSGGSNATDYTVVCTITTSDGETLELSGILRVRSSADA
jgi:hypothetical protein